MASQNDQAKKPSGKVDRQPVVGMTGMGSNTQMHFIEVQKKMDNFFAGKPPTPAQKDRNALHAPSNHQKRKPPRSPCPGNRCPLKQPVIVLGFRHT